MLKPCHTLDSIKRKRKALNDCACNGEICFRKRTTCRRQIQLKNNSYVGLDLQLKDNPTYEDVRISKMDKSYTNLTLQSN